MVVAKKRGAAMKAVKKVPSGKKTAKKNTGSAVELMDARNVNASKAHSMADQELIENMKKAATKFGKAVQAKEHHETLIGTKQEAILSPDLLQLHHLCDYPGLEQYDILLSLFQAWENHLRKYSYNQYTVWKNFTKNFQVDAKLLSYDTRVVLAGFHMAMTWFHNENFERSKIGVLVVTTLANHINSIYRAAATSQAQHSFAMGEDVAAGVDVPQTLHDLFMLNNMPCLAADAIIASYIPSQASPADFNAKVKSTTAAAHAASPVAPTNPHANHRCNKCKEMGHIKTACPLQKIASGGASGGAAKAGKKGKFIK
jgi:hypothetical protein